MTRTAARGTETPGKKARSTGDAISVELPSSFGLSSPQDLDNGMRREAHSGTSQGERVEGAGSDPGEERGAERGFSGAFRDAETELGIAAEGRTLNVASGLS